MASSLLRLACWNPMQLAASNRTLAISKQFQSLHLLGLVGTQIKENTKVGHSIRPIKEGAHQMLSFGVQEGKYTNKSTGCALLFRTPFQLTHMHDIAVPSKESGLRGRAGAVTFLCRDLRVKIILAYFPPQPWKSGTTKKALQIWHQTTQALLVWITDEWNSTPHRTVPYILTDLNSQLGQSQEGVGEFASGAPNNTGHRMREWMIAHHAAAINTFFDAGPTLVNKDGQKQIDFIIAPQSAVRFVEKMRHISTPH